MVKNGDTRKLVRFKNEIALLEVHKKYFVKPNGLAYSCHQTPTKNLGGKTLPNHSISRGHHPWQRGLGRKRTV